MAFSGNCGLRVCLPAPVDGQPSDIPLFEALFSEELGLLLEVQIWKCLYCGLVLDVSSNAECYNDEGYMYACLRLG